jgi:DHA2 family multidrug resistance protein
VIRACVTHPDSEPPPLPSASPAGQLPFTESEPGCRIPDGLPKSGSGTEYYSPFGTNLMTDGPIIAPIACPYLNGAAAPHRGAQGAAAMAPTTDQSAPPIMGLVIAGYGSMFGSLFPVMTVLSAADISGGLSVASDSGALVNTMQNLGAVAGILILPSFAAGIGRGRTMVLTGVGFVLSSIACALAPSLGWMLPARLAHGVFGGALPLMFMLLVMSSLKRGHGQFEGISLFAASTTLLFGFAAPLGGLLVDHFGWRALFWAQALAMLPYCVAATRVLVHEKGRPELLRTTDWSSHLLLSGGLGMILLALSEGERHFWFETWWVAALLVGGTILTGFGIRNLLESSRPLLLLEVFRRPTFSWAILLSLFFRFGTLFAIFIVPQYLGRVQGLRPADIGAVLGLMVPATAVALVAAHFFAGRFDPRWLLTGGLGSFALASWLCADLSPDWAGDQLRLAAIAAGFGTALFAVGVLRFATFGVTMRDGPTVGAIFNVTRVIGIVGGLAILSHLVVEREKFHSAILGESLAATDPDTAQRLASTAGSLARFTADPAAAQSGVYAALGRAATGQAFTLAFADAFTVSAIALVLSAILVWALPRIPAGIDPHHDKRNMA